MNRERAIALDEGGQSTFSGATLTALAGIFAVAIGLAAVTGWLLDSEVLKSLVPGAVSMKANAAICFVLLGVSMLLAASSSRGLTATILMHTLAGVVLAVAGATLFEYVTGRDLGIDQIVAVEPPGAVGTSHPGRMSPHTALALVALTIGLEVVQLRRLRLLVVPLVAVPFTFAALALLNHLYRVQPPAPLAAYTQMSLLGAAAVVVIAFGLLGRLPGGGALGVLSGPGAAGVLSGRLLLVGIVIPVVIGWLGLEGARRGLYGTPYGVSITVVSMILLLIGILWRSGHNLQHLDASRKAAEWALQTSGERLRQAQIVGASERRFKSLVQNSSDIVMVLDPQGRITYQSQSVERVLGYPTRDRLGHDGFIGIHPDDEAFVRGVFSNLVRTPGGEFVAEFRVRHADGSWRVMEATAKNLVDDPAVNGIVVNERDVTDRRALEEQLRHQALHDPLTGLANRILFADRVQHALARGPDTSLAVLFLDLDDFKTVNDSLGHIVGDEFLMRTAERLQLALRAEDTAARLGGDEFGILLEETNAEAAVEIAQRILSAVRRPLPAGGREVSVSASIGIALNDSRGKTAEELLRSADAAMYTAKSRGKGSLELYHSSMQAAALRRLELKAGLQRALDQGQLVLQYQPIVNIETEQVVSAEALVRWQHPARGMVLPYEFVPLAEETGLIVPIGQWALLEACRQLRDWDIAADPDGTLSVSVNLSARQLDHPEVVEEVHAALVDAGIHPSRLTLEITETALVEEGDRSIELLRQLKGLGVRLAIDDFGTGYSSLSYLRRFPVDILKIDRSFVANTGSVEEMALLRSIIELSRTLQLQTVVEGIERKDELARVRTAGGLLAQGYLFAQPMDAEGIAEMVAARRVPERTTA